MDLSASHILGSGPSPVSPDCVKETLTGLQRPAVCVPCRFRTSLSMGLPGKNTGVGCHFCSRGSSRPRDWIHVSRISWHVASLPLGHPGNPGLCSERTNSLPRDHQGTPLKIFLFKTVKKKIKYMFCVYPVTAKFMMAAFKNIFIDS